ncbi:general substrate transporter [Aspergillus caelatus]|uniref:General substrate transporter n=1 Tax=Aspergillus caelatus TaxID=61420 RepID=A0A5N6ZJL7_9EURO|nr:general substrate transporter [Aspergillus caelatus]KAE8357822.1 general substrate transporter [Aspergillus caelatus]
MASLMDSKKEPYFGLKGAACATDMSLFGYDQGLFGGVVVAEDFLTKTPSTVTAIYDVGCFFGAPWPSALGAPRKKSILLGTTLMAIGTLLKCVPYSLPQIFVGWVILGYQTETSSPKWRGKLVSLEMVMNILGLSMVNWINYGLSFAGGALMFTFVLFATVPRLPESPGWPMQMGYEKEAIEILSSQKNEIEYTIYYERENAIRWRDILLRRKTDSTDSKTLRRLILGTGTQLMQRFKGVNIISYYLPTVRMNFVGLSNSMARLLTAVNSITYLIYTCCAVGLIERMRRHGLMMLSTAGQFFAFLIITILLRYAEANAGAAEGHRFGSASTVFFFLFYIFFGLGMLEIPWLYPTKLSSLQMRNKGAAVATATNWITNFVIVEITPIRIQNIGWKFWIVWTVFNAAFLPAIYFVYPETANRTLEDIDAHYRSNPSLIVIKDPDAISAKPPLKYIEHEDHKMKMIGEVKTKKAGGLMVEHVE